MVRVIQGDLFASGAQTLVNTVNCVGVMGKGVALEFKKRFPDMYEDYVRRCKAGRVKLGRPYLYRRLVEPWILNFPTKDHWRSVARLDDIVEGLEYLKAHYKAWGITSLAVPPLGCGQGQLEWRVVGPTLIRHLKRLDIPVELYAPHGTPAEEMGPAFLDPGSVKSLTTAETDSPPRIEPGWLALVAILDRIEREPYHWPVGRVMFQKIAYFATESGIPTGLSHVRASFGPFSPELKSVVTRLANNGLIREERAGRMFRVTVGPTFKDALANYSTQLEPWTDTMDRVADLFLRMDSDQAEVAATVHFTARSLAERSTDPPTESKVLSEALRWKQRRRPPLSEGDVAAAIRGLGMLGWLQATPSPNLPVADDFPIDDAPIAMAASHQ